MAETKAKNEEVAPVKEAVKKEEAPLVLPTQKLPALHQSPKNLIIFSMPKMGKTELAALLENALHIDFEEGSDYVEAMKVKVKTMTELGRVGKAVKEAKFPYKYVVADTITAMESMCVPYAETLYSKSPMGKHWFTPAVEGQLSGKQKYGDILNLPNGAGYSWLRQAYQKALNMLKAMAPRVVLLGHVKNVALDNKDAEMSSMDLDLTGRIKRITTSQSDAIGYLYRRGDNINILSFKSKDDVLCGARPNHLRNQEIEISEMGEDGVLTANWDKVFID